MELQHLQIFRPTAAQRPVSARPAAPRVRSQNNAAEEQIARYVKHLFNKSTLNSILKKN